MPSDAIVLFLFLAVWGAGTAVQHQHHEPSPMPTAEPEAAMAEHAMHGAGVLDLPHPRNGTGTSWQPDSTPIYAIHFMAGGWRLMLHGNLQVGYDVQGSDRGDDRFTSMNWIMLMAEHPLLGGELGLRAMLSGEPATVGKEGYPLLLQTGESRGGLPIHDRQHAHDLFMELALLHSQPVTDAVAVQIYGAAVGEPALGPPAFPHRVSAISNPLAPLGHHWQDSTHISFGVATLGVFTRLAKLEGSWFNGREPDETRYDLDLRALDSASARFTINPSPDWSLQASYGYLDSPEELEPDVSLQRITASAICNRRLGSDGSGNWATTAAWGRNVPARGADTDSFLLESNLDLDGRNVIFGRGELVTKTGRDLDLPPPGAEATFTIGALALGYERNFGPVAWLVPALGALGSVNFLGDGLRPFYGTRVPVGFLLYLHLRPIETRPHSAH